MKRLSVRLSVVGAILALGAAAIVHSVLSKGETASASDTSKNNELVQSKSKKEVEKSLTPIRPPAGPTMSFPTSTSSDSDGTNENPVVVPRGESSTYDSANLVGFRRDATSPPLPMYGGSALPSETNGADSSIDDRDLPPNATFPSSDASNRASARVSDEPVERSPPLAGDSSSTRLTIRSSGDDASGSENDPNSQFPAAQSPATQFPNQYPPTRESQQSPTGTEETFGSGEPTQTLPVDPNATAYPRSTFPETGTGANVADDNGGSPTADPTSSYGQFGAGGPSEPGSEPAGISTSTTTGNRFPSAPREATSDPASSLIGQTMPTGSPAQRSLTTQDTPSPVIPSTPRYGAGSRMTDSLTATPPAVMASNLPGDSKLEGQQTPAIALEKLAPDEIQVDRQVTFQIRVRNVGNAPAHQVVVVDQIPRGTEFVEATPQYTQTPDGMIIWQLDTIQPGEETVLTMDLLPKVAGEIGSVAQATFQATASVRTICTKPQLSLELSAPEKVLIGQSATLDVTVTNTGTGAATNVVIEEDVPEGFKHAAGRQLETDIGTLRPQESRRLTLVLDSAIPGTFENRLTVRGDANLSAIDVRTIQVVSPKLDVAIRGPSLRYLDRQATYTLTLVNPGTAAARNVELAAYLPKGMQFVTSDNYGQYDSQSHAVYWSLEELPPDDNGEVQVTILPTEPGNLKLKAAVKADLGLAAAREYQVVVEALAQLVFTIADVVGPIEVGSETTYEIAVRNRGSQSDSDIQLVAQLPAGVTPVSGDGPTQGVVQGQHVVFGPLAQLAPNQETVFRIRATGDVAGDHVIRAQLQSAEIRVPITKEEITRVYEDR